MKTTLSFLFAVLSFCTVYPQAPTISGDVMLCPNTNGTASITNGVTYDSYTWYWRYWFLSDPYEVVPGANGPTFTYDWQTYDQAQLKVVVTLNGNTYESNVIQIDSYAWVGFTVGFDNTPNVSIDDQTGNVNLCEGTGFTLQVYEPYEIVQWYKDGVPIAGATAMQLHITEAGSYYAVAAPAFCPDSSSSNEGLPVVVQIDTGCALGTHHPEETTFSVYPNPVQHTLTLASAQPIEKITVYNMIGQEVLAKDLTNNTADLSGLPAGMYVIEAESGGKLKQMKIIKE